MSAFRSVCAVAAFAVAIASLAFRAAAGDSVPAIAKTPLPAVLDVTSGDMPKTPTVAVEIRTGSVAPRAATIWHTHPSPPFVYVESGTGRWEYKDGRPAETRSAGQAIEEPANVVTRIVNDSSAPLSLVIFQISKPGDPVLVPAP
jgi:quercetin dioxygenase-like cupin family protein